MLRQVLPSLSLLGLCLAASAPQAWAYHPLDPFSPEEAADCLAFLASHSPDEEGGVYFDKTTDRISAFYEQDPNKADVLAWDSSQPALPRKFYVVIAKPDGFFKGVAVPSQEVVPEWSRIDTAKGGGPPVDTEEFFSLPQLVFENDEFMAGLTKRGLTKADVNCAPMSWGGRWNASFAKQEQAGDRLLHITCLVVANTTNPWLRPVPLLSAVVDSGTRKVLQVYDRPGFPDVPPANNYDDATLDKELKPYPPVHGFTMSQPEGPSYTIEGSMVTWQSWKFHAKPHPRAGVMISQASFQDPRTKKFRSVLYTLHPSELFVPYQNPDLDFANRVYEDVGEYGFGVLGSTMGVPSDCPTHSSFLNGTLVGGDGSIVVVEKAVCLFERPSAVPAWRHTEVFGTPFASGRTQVELVARMVTTVGNYDYIVDVIFKQEGGIMVSVTATGIVEIQPTADTFVDPADRFAREPYGTLISPNHIASFHSHFFNFKIDLDPDGPQNRFVREKLIKVRLPEDNVVGRKSIWMVKEEVVGGELDARLFPDPATPDVWNFRHTTSTSTNTRNPVGYKLIPGITSSSLLDEDDPPQKRAMFAMYPLWVTQQRDTEVWSAGDLVYQADGHDDGIAAWTSQNRSLVDRDLVAWYTVGIHHVVRQEDAPVMPSLTQSFYLMPENFFQDNPAMVIPPDQAACH